MLLFAEKGRTMILIHNITVLLFFCVTWAYSQEDFKTKDLNETNSDVKLLDKNDVNLTLIENQVPGAEKVHIQLYIESLCPHCIRFEVNQVSQVLETMQSYINVSTYPFGIAMMREDDNGKMEFRCQHGPAECYGNKLHACAIDILQNTTALLYNICLMNTTAGSGSDDASADRCGKSMNIESESIKECAKGTRGIELLRYYGEESETAHVSHVPYVLINGKELDDDDFESAICDALTNPPPNCNLFQ